MINEQVVNKTPKKMDFFRVSKNKVMVHSVDLQDQLKI